MKKSNLTVTIGIPVYNEERNITYLIKSILKQEQGSYALEKIIVISDGSSDSTKDIVQKLAINYPIINLLADGKRLGKQKRLLQLYKINTSDIVIQLDGDMILSSPKVIAKLVKGFLNKKIVAVGGNMQPVIAESFFEKIANWWFKIWYEVRRDLNDGDSINNVLSSILALDAKFAKKLKLNPKIFTTGQFIYCLIKQKKLLFHYADGAIIYFRMPTNLSEYLIQTNRSSSERKQLAQVFGTWIYELYTIPKDVKLRILCKNLLSNPFYTISAGLFFLYLRFIPFKQQEENTQGLWKIIPSTKSGLYKVFENI